MALAFRMISHKMWEYAYVDAVPAVQDMGASTGVLGWFG
jgi:hypothetical protein